MAIFQTTEGEPVHFQEGALPGYSGKLLKGASILSSITDQWQMMMQEIKTELYSIRHHFLQIESTLRFRGHSAKGGIHSRFMLRNHLKHRIEPIGKIQIGEGQFSVLWSDEASCQAKFEAGQYEALDVYYSPGLSEQIAAFFPDLRQAMNDGATKLLRQPSCFISPSLKDVLRQIIECPYDAGTRQLYFDIKVRELLYVMLEQGNQKTESIRLSDYEISRVIEAREILLKDISRTYSIRELSKAVAINEFKLKAGFKQLFGTGVLECLTEARMEKARELLLNTTKPIKEICAVAGYPRMTNFITAFRRKFGYTPGSLRRM